MDWSKEPIVFRGDDPTVALTGVWAEGFGIGSLAEASRRSWQCFHWGFSKEQYPMLGSLCDEFERVSGRRTSTFCTVCRLCRDVFKGNPRLIKQAQKALAKLDDNAGNSAILDATVLRIAEERN